MEPLSREPGLAQEIRSRQRQLVGLRCELHARKERQERRDWNDYHPEQVVQPGNFDECVFVLQGQVRILGMVAGLASDYTVFIIPLDQVEERRDGMQQSQLEGPEGEQEHTDHRVSDEGQHADDDHDGDGGPGVPQICPVDLASGTDIDSRLPDDEDQQGRGEDQRDDAGRQEDRPKQDRKESQQQRGDIEIPGRFGLRSRYPDQERDKDGKGQPEEGH